MGVKNLLHARGLALTGGPRSFSVVVDSGEQPVVDAVPGLSRDSASDQRRQLATVQSDE